MLNWLDKLTVLNVAFSPCRILCPKPRTHLMTLSRFFLLIFPDFSGHFGRVSRVDTLLSLEVSYAYGYIYIRTFISVLLVLLALDQCIKV